MQPVATATSGLTAALRIMAQQAQILPASGHAIVDLAAPDIDEAYDRVETGDARVKGIWEDASASLYRPIIERARSVEHRFKYFLDGSVRTYFIGTVLEHDRSSAIQFAQVGAAAVARSDEGRFSSRSVRQHQVLLADKSMLSEALWSALSSNIASYPAMRLENVSSPDPYSRLSQDDQRAKGSHKANWIMRDAERRTAIEDLSARGPEDWLILDGALGNEFLRWTGPPLVGVAKTFRRDSQFTIGTGPRAKTFNLYSLLAGLQYGQRTAVFPRSQETEAGLVAYWYVRLRPQSAVEYPIMGVVKVEIPCSATKPLASELADAISGSLLAERNVTPYGADHRWHAHLYPVYLAETVIKNSFWSEDIVKAAIRWPRSAA